MADFVYGEWYYANKGTTKKLGWFFNKFEKDKVSIYVPMYRRQDLLYLKPIELKGARAWNQYIEENLLSGITVKQIAEHFYYCERHFTDTYEMYFGIRPGLYMKKRKLSLALNEMRGNPADVENIAEKYGYISSESFEHDFEQVFSCKPEQYEGEEVKAEDLQQYYQFHKQTLHISYVQLEDIFMMGEDVTERNRYERDSLDLIEIIAWVLKHETFAYAMSKVKDHRIVVWQTVMSKRSDNRQKCLVGPEVEIESVLAAQDKVVRIKGGLYAMMESLNDSDEDNLSWVYRMLYRCSFDGWLRDNQTRIDLRRLTFVRYTEGKLYFFIPING